MWIEKRGGKIYALERYIDPMTGKRKRTSVSISKDTKREREKARLALAEKIRQLQSQEDTAPQLVTLGDTGATEKEF